ncbi:sulfotransferase [Vulcanococcus sp. Clear-D1]|uniref:sulfotransferase family protein n=1 Tax=Vulcanococcus sp. Clear-D1 TaxID=2766970 RepID=UPI00198C07AE|nr:sulfotransferase [Vulcanococcus sp. Clear-D1]MBD1194208.1 sulfotransferase [Vulcanococcus sp. Clear-D1]
MTSAPEAVFIGGCPRSGTTLLASLLGGFPGCVVTPESQFKHRPLQRLHRQPEIRLSGEGLAREWRSHLRFRHWGVDLLEADLEHTLDPQALRALLLALVGRMAKPEQQSLAAVTWIDHTPQNIELGLALSSLFPTAKLIHLVRDPRAVAASLLPLDWGPHSTAGIASLWSHRLAHGLALEKALPERILRVHYEDLCRHPEDTLKHVAAWLGLTMPTNRALLQPTCDFLPRYTRHQHQRIGERPQVERINAWRGQLEPWQQRELEGRLGELMALMGYPADAEPPRPGDHPPSLWQRRIWPLVRALRGRIRHRRHQRLHAQQLR